MAWSDPAPVRRRAGFTLVELLVVVAITAVLVGLMLPAVARAWDTARTARCASNLHQITVALTAYVSANRGRYPPDNSTPSPGQSWYDDDHLGRFLTNVRPPVPDSKPKAAVYVCPGDGPGTVILSYAMNYWAGSKADSYASNVTAAQRDGTLWTPSVREPARMILVTEAYSGYGTTAANQWYAKATVGQAISSGTVTTPAQRFGANGGIVLLAGRWGHVLSELCFMHHRSPADAGRGTLPRGRINIGYADGHVAAKTDRDLIRPDGTVTGDSCWSPADLAPVGH